MISMKFAEISSRLLSALRIISLSKYPITLSKFRKFKLLNAYSFMTFRIRVTYRFIAD